jgi:hypothetical protein
MDNTLKAAYAALEKWKKNVTVKDFVRDNKRLNSIPNPNSPKLNEFMQLSTSVQTNYVPALKSQEIIEIYQDYINLLSTEPKSSFEYFLDTKEVIEQIISLNQTNNFRSITSKSMSKNVISIVVKSRNDKIVLTRPEEKSFIWDADKNIKRLLALDERHVPRNRPSTSDEILRSYSSQQQCAAY